MKTAVIVLAAGKGTRMKSEKAKVLHEIGGKSLLSYVLEASVRMASDKTIVVVGHQSDAVKKAFPDKNLFFADQKEQLGTGHAVMQAEKALKGFKGNILILSGDVPLITLETLKGLMDLHVKSKATLTVLTTELENPSGYGRIIKDPSGNIKKIVEEKDASAAERKVREINTGIYCVASEFMFKALMSLKPKNAQKEYYLTDIVGMAVKDKKKALTHMTLDSKEVMGINSRLELAEAELVLRKRVLEKLMTNGVTIVDPASTYISQSVVILPDAIIFPGSMIGGDTSIGKGTVIGPGCIISDSKIGDSVNIKAYSVIDKSSIEDGAFIGPMAHVRPESVIRNGAHIGNFVEVKKTTIGEGSKANHLTYLGDATIGKGVNIGAGTITCNYDGAKKHQTIIEDNVFVGSDTQFVAPVRIGEGSLIGAGTTVTEDVKEGSLVLSRVRQITKEGLAKKYLKRKG